MTAIDSVYEEVNSDTTHTGDTNWTTVLTSSSADWIANATYILWIQAIVGGDDTTVLFHFRLAHGATPTVFDEAEAIWEMSSGSDRRRQEYFYQIEYTVPSTAEDIVFQHMTTNGANTVKSAHVILLAIRLDADLTEGKDYKYAEDSGVNAHTTSQQAGASITFTPDNANDDWLVINSNSIGIKSTSGRIPTYRINRDSGADVAPSYEAEGEDTTEVRIQGQQRVYTLSAAAHTFDVEYIDLSPATNDHNRSSIFAMRLDVFEDHDFAWTEAEFTFTVGDEQWEELNGIPTYTPTTAGDNILMGHGVIDQNVAGGASLRIQVGGVSEPTDDPVIPGGALVFQKARRYDDRDEQPMTCMGLVNMAASSQDIDLDGWVTLIASQNIEDRSLVVFSLELAAGGAGINVTLVAATAVSAAQIFVVSIARIIALVAATAVSAAQPFVISIARIITLVTATAVSAAQILVLNLGSLSVTLVTSTATSAAQALVVNLAALTTTLVAAVGASAAQPFIVTTAQLITLVASVSPAAASILTVSIVGAVTFGRIPNRPTQATIPSYANRSNKR